jgi:hypothetical protein
MTPALALELAALLWAQADAVSAARKDLGGGFSVEEVQPGILLATASGAPPGGMLRESLRASVKSFRARALDVLPHDSLLVILFGGAEAYRSYTSQRYPGPVPQTTFYDVPNRRVLLRTEAAGEYVRQIVRIFLLSDSLNGGTLPPWIAAALSALEDPDPHVPTFDHRAALLREALRRGALPPLHSFLSMDLGTFHSGPMVPLHTSMALKLSEYLESRGALKRFYEEYRASFRRDPTGASALEAALGGPLEEVERTFRAHLKDLPWLNERRFVEQARQVFGPTPLIRVDENLMLAVTGDVEPKVAQQALDQLHRLRDPLIKLFDLRLSGLPVLARLFRDQGSFQEYAKMDAPHRQWLGGYFSYESRWLVLHLEPDSGSLTHEFCHALFEDDVGRLPPWLSEGLACLFQNFTIEGGIPLGDRGGSTAHVRAALGRNEIGSLAEFVALKGAGFFDPDRVNLNYDCSHALLWYLQDQHALVPLYREVKRAKAENPLAPPAATCRGALEKALGAPIDQIGESFRTWVMLRRD